MTHNPSVNRFTKTNITPEEIQLLPMRAFAGRIELINTPDKLQDILPLLHTTDVLGFDTETRPSFKRGEFHKVALVQFAFPDQVFLIQIHKTGVTEELARLLSHAGITKAGVAIRDDIKGLQKFRRFEPEGFVDLAVLARESGLEVESVKKLTALLLGFRISKTAQTSNWETPDLTDKQIEYAATDAWVCLEIYRKLTSK
jgi:ribonuclease D